MSRSKVLRHIVGALVCALASASVLVGIAGPVSAATAFRPASVAAARGALSGAGSILFRSPVVTAIDAAARQAVGGLRTGNVTGPSCTFNGQDPTTNPILSGVTPGESISLPCSGFPPGDALVAAEFSPLALTVPSSQSGNEVDLNDADYATTDSQGNAGGSFVVPNPFSAADPNAVCPPTAAQVSQGLLRCGILVTDGVNSSSIALDYATAPVPTPTPTPTPTPAAPTVTGMAATPDGGGYWIVNVIGGVSTHGDAAFYGSMASTTLNAPINHIVSTPDGRGYWLVAGDGGTFAFGDAGFYGSMGGRPLNKPVVDIAPTSDGLGYWLVASDGGIFAFGDAGFRGSMGGNSLNKPVVGIVPDWVTGGYWEVATDGGIFAFGAPFFGSTGAIHLNQPVNGMAPTANDHGYWFVASDGGIFAYGNAGFYGSTGGTPLNAPIVGMAADTLTGGYWLVASDGGIFAYNAPFLGAG